MQIAVSGASGLVGSALSKQLEGRGDTVRPFVRREAKAEAEIEWRPGEGRIDVEKLGEADAVVHLAGENIATGRWTDAKKQRIRDSRVEGTRLIAESLAALDERPKALVAASAIGYYGDRGDERLTEGAASGKGFLPEVCREWEAATAPAAAAGVRVVNLRIGVVLSSKGGALAKMLTPFKLGLGGVIGGGAQFMSWVELDDLAGMIVHALDGESLRGPVNAVAPQPVTNREFTKTLGRVLGRPTIFPMPAFAARLAFGEMADELLLASTRVAPERLEASGYAFMQPELEGALRKAMA